jgi:hypothetical protein
VTLPIVGLGPDASFGSGFAMTAWTSAGVRALSNSRTSSITPLK